MDKRRLKNDILLILALLVLAAALWGMLWHHKKQGGEAVVRVDGTVVERLPLDRSATLTLKTEDSKTNTVVVEDGRACVVSADCPDRICVRRGWIQYEGESIVCLPHRLTVSIYGGEALVDAVAQ